MIVSTGEQVTIALAGAGDPGLGVRGAAVTPARRCACVTDSAFTRARIVSIDERAAPRRSDRGRRRPVRRGLPGHRRGRQHHDARPRRLGHLGGRARRGAQGRRLRDLHRRRRRLHHRPAHRARGAPPQTDHLRGDARAGEPRREGAADPLGRVRRQVQGAAARALVLQGSGRWHAGHLRGRREDGTGRRLRRRVQPRRGEDHACSACPTSPGIASRSSARSPTPASSST